MPDVLAGVAVLGIALVALYWTALTRIERAGTATLLTFCFVVHTSHLLLGVVLVPVAALLLRWLRVPLRAVAVRGAVVIGALVAASALNAGYGHYVLAQTGQPLRHQPFVMARVLADGPGRVYLRRTCAGGSGLALCRFKNLPLDDSEDILWSDLPNRGVFLMADYATRVRLEDEELGFVLGTIADDPVGQIRVSAQNWARQLTMVGVDDVVRDPRYYLTDDYWSKTYLPDMIMAVAHCGRRGDACPLRLTPRALTVDSGLNGRSPPAPVSARAYGAVVIAALALTGALMWRVRREPVRPLLALAALILAAVVLNAGVTGVISGPFARYQARLIWLVPALCGVVLMAARMPMLGKRRETA